MPEREEEKGSRRVPSLSISLGGEFSTKPKKKEPFVAGGQMGLAPCFKGILLKNKKEKWLNRQKIGAAGLPAS